MNKSKVWAVLSTYITAMLAMTGMFAFGFGTPSMSFLGLELTPAIFWGLIAILLAINIQSLYAAFSKKQNTESAPVRMRVRTAVPCGLHASANVSMARPATIRLFKAATVWGIFKSPYVWLNGVKYDKLRMGMTLSMRTGQQDNRLSVGRGGRARETVADLTVEPGEVLTLMFAYRGGAPTLTPLPATAHWDAKGRYRRVPGQDYAWTICITLLCLLGLVPLIKLHKAERESDHAAAQLLLASALKWNLALTLPGMAMVCYLLYYITQIPS